MNAKHSAILLAGLLLVMIGIAWADAPNIDAPTCPAVSDDSLQEMLKPTAWARADWNAKTSRWDIDCTQMDAIANMPASYPANAYNTVRNTAVSPTNSLPPRRSSRSNINYVNTNPYNSASMYVLNVNVNANMPANAIKPAKRRPRS